MSNLNFFIEQIAIAPKNPALAKALLAAMAGHASADEAFAEDHVCATGKVFGTEGSNEANLSFNYDFSIGGVNSKPLEFEVLDYTDGDNWVDTQRFSNHVEENASIVSHLGMHCTAAQLVAWREFFKERGIIVAQEVITDSHTNPVIAGQRRYNYVIFDTRDILGVDIKFIVRLTPEGEAYE